MRTRCAVLTSAGCALAALLGAQDAPLDAGTIRLRVAGSSAFAEETDLPVKSALLFLDSVRYESRGEIASIKSVGTMRVVLSDMSINCDCGWEPVASKDTFASRLMFGKFYGNALKLPEMTEDRSFLLVAGRTRRYDSRQHSRSPFVDMFVDPGRRDLGMTVDVMTGPLPGGKKPAKGSTIDGTVYPVRAVHLYALRIAIAYAGQGSGEADPSKQFKKLWDVTGRSVFAYEEGELYLDTKEKEPPFPPAALVLRRDGDEWHAKFEASEAGSVVRGTVPLKTCPVFERAVSKHTE